LQGLGAFKDPKLADLFINVINTEQSYQAVAEAARALGQTGAPGAYNVLMDLTKQDSWQEVIRGGALEGLAALKDPRALDLALQYAAAGNRASVRRAAIPLLGDLGKGDDRAFNTLMAVFSEATRNRSMQLGFAGVQALGALGDARAIPALEEAMKSGNLPSFAKQALNGAINRIRKANEAGGEKKE
jgi:aminopeptidase N